MRSDPILDVVLFAVVLIFLTLIFGAQFLLKRWLGHDVGELAFFSLPLMIYFLWFCFSSGRKQLLREHGILICLLTGFVLDDLKPFLHNKAALQGVDYLRNTIAVALVAMVLWTIWRKWKEKRDAKEMAQDSQKA